jgi:hypothetical protein
MALVPRWREKAWKIASKLGSAASQDANEGDLSQDQEATSTSNTSAMEGMGLGDRTTSPKPQKSSLFAESITNSGSTTTGWTESPQRVVEEPYLLSEEFLPMEYLADGYQEKLETLAEDMGIGPYDLVKQIMEFYIENEHDIVELGTVEEALMLYLDNEVLI